VGALQGFTGGYGQEPEGFREGQTGGALPNRERPSCPKGGLAELGGQRFFSRWLRALPAAVLDFLPVRLLRKTRDAADAALLPVTFFAIGGSPPSSPLSLSTVHCPLPTTHYPLPTPTRGAAVIAAVASAAPGHDPAAVGAGRGVALAAGVVAGAVARGGRHVVLLRHQLRLHRRREHPELLLLRLAQERRGQPAEDVVDDGGGEGVQHAGERRPLLRHRHEDLPRRAVLVAAGGDVPLVPLDRELVRQRGAGGGQPPPHRVGAVVRFLLPSSTFLARAEHLRPLGAVAVDGQRLQPVLPALDVRLLDLLHGGLFREVDCLGDGAGDERLDGANHPDVAQPVDRADAVLRLEGGIQNRG